jgi:hypothetical protein
LGPLDKLTWKEYLLIGGLLIIWAISGFFSIQALSDNDIVTIGYWIFIGVILTGGLLIIIAIIDRVF